MPEAVAVVANVPEVGKVTVVFPVIVPVNVNAPEKAVLPPTVIVPVLATPVPPKAGVSGTVALFKLLLVAILKSF
jgi:hypothetical protein